MPIYEFKTRDGRIVEEFFHADNAPQIGSSAIVHGQSCERIASRLEGCVKPDIRFVSLSLPKGVRNKSGEIVSAYSRHCDKDGHPVFTSKREVAEAEAKSRYLDGDYAVKWD